MARVPLVLSAVLGAALVLSSAGAAAQAADGVPAPARFRIVLNGAYLLGSSPSFDETRTVDEYAEQTTVRVGYETRSAFGPDGAVQVSVFRGLGLRVGYSSVSRDETGTVEVSRPHPLHFDRPRQASAELSGFSYVEKALHLDAALARSAGHLDWSLFAGVTLFRVEADLLGQLTYDDVYPYHELAIASAPGVNAEASPTGFNVGAGLDYRFGGSGTFGLGLQILYSTADVELQATPEDGAVTFKAGGLQAAAGVRIYF